MTSFFYNIYTFFKKSKLLFYGFLVLYIVGFGYIASRLSFEEDISKLVPSSSSSEMTNKVLKKVNFADKIVVLISADTTGKSTKLSAYAEEMIDSIKQNCPSFVKSIDGKFSDENFSETLDFIQANLPLFLDDADYEQILQKLATDSIREITQDNYRTLISPRGILSRNKILNDPLSLMNLGLKKLEALNISEDFILKDGFIVSRDERHLLFFVNPMLGANETDQNQVFVNKLTQIKKNLDEKHLGQLRANFYGTLVISVANAKQIKKDIQLTITIAMSILFVILILFYRKLLIPILLFIPPLLGGLLAVGFLVLYKGKISAISLGIGAVLLGITLDYSLHILTHFRNKVNIEQLFKDVTKPILMSSLTTAVAFLCLLFLQSEALQDLGIFAAISVIGAAVIALICIPQFYRPTTNQKRNFTLIDKIAKYPLHRNKNVVIGLILLIIVSSFWIKQVEFDKDIAKLNYLSNDLKETEITLNELMNHGDKSLYAVSYGNSVDEALKNNQKLSLTLDKWADDGIIKKNNGIGGLVQDSELQRVKIKKWNEFWREHGENLKTNLIKEGGQLGFKDDSFSTFYKSFDHNEVSLTLNDFQQLAGLNLSEYINDSESDFVTVSSLIKVGSKDATTLKQKLRMIDNTVIIDRQEMNETFLGDLKNNFNRLIGYSFLAIVVMLWIFYGNFMLMLITVIPIAITWFLSVGIMGFLGIDFNIFNVIISTFIFGLGVDYCIFMTNGLIKDYTYSSNEITIYKTSVLLSVITTILALGVLIFAQHPALRSISLVSLIGVLSAMLVCFVFQPILFNLIIQGRADKGLAPLRIRTTVHGILLSLFYAIGGMILSVFSITILPLIPIAKEKKMRWLHRTMSHLVTATLYGNPFVKKEIHNPLKENFKKPAVIIANHSSALDTLTIGMVNPNVIYLVNDWVYKSPIFGLLARVAGFYPVSSGVDGSLSHLNAKVKQGYSLVVFPESKRSMTNKVGRFHKGAFHLANALKLDILPIYLHGNAEVMPKKDFVIYDGNLSVHVGERIAFDDLNFGSSERERTKKISTFFKEKLQELRASNEDENYFKNKLLSNYHFKPEISGKIRQDFESQKNVYEEIEKHIGPKETIGYFANDYGQLTILLKSSALDRSIFCYYEDDNKQQIAKSCYTNSTKRVVYVDELAQMMNHPIKTMIFDRLPNEFDALREFLTLQVEQVVLKNNIDSKFFTDLGFKLQSDNAGVMVLDR